MRKILIYKATRVLVVALAASLACLAQNATFGLSSGSGAPGSTVELNLSVDAPLGVAPAAVQWVLNYPPSDFSSASVAAINEGGKSVSCEMGVGSASCVLWGDNNTQIASGPAATVSLVISGSTLDTTSQVQISSPMAASPDAFAFDSSATGGTVTIIQPPGLDGFSCTPGTITFPASATCTVQLSAAATGTGALIGLSASVPDVTIPLTVTVGPGLSSAVFTVTALTVTSPVAVNLTASYLGVTEGFGLTVDPELVVLKSVTVTPANIHGGQTGKGTVTISGPAGSGGLVVTLVSSNTAVATVPTSVTILAGATTAAFTVTSIAPPKFTRLSVSGSYEGVTSAANFAVRRY